jgi:glycosyltransferase involved in cell wall biosynthesis
MRIAVNTRLLLKGRLEGIGWFTYETLKRIVADHPKDEFIFIFDRTPDPEFIFGPNVKAVIAYPQARHPILWFLFFEFGVRRVLRKYKPDLFLSPDGWLSLSTSVKSLAVIHDLNFEARPEFLPWHIRFYYRYFFPRFAKKAVRIATVSEFTRRDIATLYGVQESKIDVVYNGANDDFRPLSVEEISEVRRAYSSGKPYFLFVGLIHPRKNLENQLRAFEEFKRSSGSDLKFLVVGARHWWSKELELLTTTSPFRDDVIFLGRKSLDELVLIYGGAFALMYVSYFEGFGIPILEAFRAEIPVITSSSSSMPEICGKAGLIVQPDDVDGTAAAMSKLNSEPQLRTALVELGKIQSNHFSWDKTAELLWQSIQKAVSSQA